MHTNLFLVLRDALAWVAAHPGAALLLTRVQDGLKVQAQAHAGAPSGVLGLPPAGESVSWTLSAQDLMQSFATDPVSRAQAVPVEAPLADRIGAELRAYLSKPLGLEALAKTLLVPDSPVAVAVQARAAELRSRLQAGDGITPPLPPRETLVPRVRVHDLLRGG